MNYYFDVFRKYADFSGRARRAEFWYFALFNFIAVVILAIFGAVVDSMLGRDAWVGMLPYFAYILAIIVPSLSVRVRRLHDTGRSGWWFFLLFVPLVGPIILLIWDCLDSQPGTNQWGPNPKGIDTPPASAFAQ